MVCRIKNARSGSVVQFDLLGSHCDFLSDLLLVRGYEYDAPSRSFLMDDSDFLKWIVRGNRFASVLDAYSFADGSARLAAELVAGLYSGPVDGLLCQLERVLGVS